MHSIKHATRPRRSKLSERRCLPKVFFERILQERWRGQVTSCISRHPALAPALAVKIDAAYRRLDFLKGFCKKGGVAILVKSWRCANFPARRSRIFSQWSKLQRWGRHGSLRKVVQVTSCISRHPALAPALAVKIDAAYRRYFLKGFCPGQVLYRASPCRQNRRCLPKAFFERILQERWRSHHGTRSHGPAMKGFCKKGGVARSHHISRHPALAPALAVKIDAAPFQKFDPPSQTSYCNLPNWAQQERPLLPVDS